MLQLGCRARFTEKLFGLIFIKLTLAGNLDGNRAIQLPVPCLPNAAEGTDAYLFDQLKVADGPFLGPAVCHGIGGIGQQIETASARRTVDIRQLGIFDQFNRVPAMGTADVHGNAFKKEETNYRTSAIIPVSPAKCQSLPCCKRDLISIGS